MKRTNKLKVIEDDIQGPLEDFLDWEKIPYIHIPDLLFNFVFSKFLTSVLSKYPLLYGMLQGVFKAISKYLLGVPDLIIFNPREKDSLVLCIELKTKTGTVRQGQRNWAKRVPVHVFRKVKPAIEFIKDWLKQDELSCDGCSHLHGVRCLLSVNHCIREADDFYNNEKVIEK